MGRSTKRIGRLGALAALALGVHTTCGEQPKVECTASRSTFAARYTLVSGSGACAGLAGEMLGVQTYVPDPTAANPGPNTVAIKSGTVGDEEQLGLQARPQVLDPNPAHKTFAVGAFSSVHPDADGLCHIPSLSPAELERGPVPTSRMLDPAVSIKHLWSNVRFLVTPAHTGVVMEADLTYVQDGCEAQYKVVAISPAADCNDGHVQPDPSKCSPEADSSKGFAGSGIAPEFATECVRDPSPPEPKWVACLPAGPFPSFK